MQAPVHRRAAAPGGALRASPRTALIAALVVLATIACRGSSTPDVAAPGEALKLVERALGSDAVEKDFFELCDRFGDRVSGSVGCEAAGRWLASRLRDAGLESVRTEPFPLVDPWIPGVESATCTDPVFFPVRVSALPGSKGTPASDVSLRVALLATGDVDPSSAIALFPTPPLPSVGQIEVGALRDAASKAAKEGFRALLIQSALPGRTLYRLRVATSGDLPLPVAVAAREDFERLVRLAATGPARVALRIEPSRPTSANGLNVFGEIRGTERPDEIVLLGAHYDAWDQGAGAQDNAVNVALVLGVARAFKESRVRPRRTVRFVFFSGEEQDRQGSAAYVREHDSELDRHALTLFFDLGGGHIDGYYFNERRELAELFKEALAPFRDYRDFRPLNVIYSGTDNLDFLLHGVPNVVAATVLEPYAPVYHTELDLPGAVDLRTLRRNVGLASAVAWQMASWPSRPTTRLNPAETRKLVERFGVRRQIEGTWRWDRLRERSEAALPGPSRP